MTTSQKFIKATEVLKKGGIVALIIVLGAILYWGYTYMTFLQSLETLNTQKDPLHKTIAQIEDCEVFMCMFLLQGRLDAANKQLDLINEYLKIFDGYWQFHNENSHLSLQLAERLAALDEKRVYFSGRLNCPTARQYEQLLPDVKKEYDVIIQNSRQKENAVAEIVEAAEGKNKELLRRIYDDVVSLNQKRKEWFYSSYDYVDKFTNLLQAECQGANIKEEYYVLVDKLTSLSNQKKTGEDIGFDNIVNDTKDLKEFNNFALQ